jgi:uncharacterized protein Usg
MSVSHLERQLQGYRLATAEILYRLPDHPVLLQSYIWQEFDLAPRFPILMGFLKFWEDNLDGKLHHVIVGAKEIISEGEWRTPEEFRIQ